MTGPLLTAAQVARLAGCSCSYVQILRRSGEITAASAEPRLRGLGGHGIDYRFDESAVQACRIRKAQARNNQRTGGRASRVGGADGRRYWCSDMGRNCVFTPQEGHCTTCQAEHKIDSVCAGASSSWVCEVVGAGR